MTAAQMEAYHGPSLEDEDKARLRAERQARRQQKAEEAARYWPRRLYWPKDGKPKAMDEWSQVVMASGASRKALKVAWVLSFAFNSDDGACWEWKQNLAPRGGMTRQAFKDGLTELERLCLITRRREMRGTKLMTVIYPSEPVEKGSFQQQPSASEVS
jgi:hypothetical protein